MKRKSISFMAIFCLPALLTACSGSARNISQAGELPASSEQVVQVGEDLLENAGNSSDEETEVYSYQKQGGLEHISEMLGRYSTQDGMYLYEYTRPTNDEVDDSHDNLKYIDYATRKKVYLCNKSNCSHGDATCTSYIPITGADGLFTYGGKLYRASNSEINGLIVSDLDGENQKTLYHLESGMMWQRDIVIGDGKLYADVMVMEQGVTEDGVGFMAGDSNNSRLLSIDLETGSANIIYDLTNKEIAGAFEHYIVISERNQDMTFSLLDVENGHVEEVGKTNDTWAYSHWNGSIYYASSSGMLSVLNLLTGENTSTSFPLPESTDSLEVYSGFAVCTQMGSNGVNAYFAINVLTGERKEINLFQSGLDFQYEVEIQGEWGEYFFVKTGCRMETEYVEWAGVWQDYIAEEYYALIKKEDFFAGRGEYLPIQ